MALRPLYKTEKMRPWDHCQGGVHNEEMFLSGLKEIDLQLHGLDRTGEMRIHHRGQLLVVIVSFFFFFSSMDNIMSFEEFL